MQRKGNLFVLSGPSGAGKGTLVKRVLERVPDAWLSVSDTTRSPREGEIDGVHYFFVDDAEFDQLEKNIYAMPSVTELLHAGKTPEDMMQMALAGFAPNVLDERTVQYQCDCSAERTKEMLLSLGRAELARMRDEDPTCEVVCHFCHSKYQYDLNALLAEYDAQAAEAAQSKE